MNMDIRQEFEAWSDESPNQLEKYTNGSLKGEYCDLEMQYAWRAYQAGRRAGAEEMRERAAKEAERIANTGGKWPSGDEGEKANTRAVRTMMQDLGNAYAEVIRALPVEE
jgi:hypothetical protein